MIYWGKDSEGRKFNNHTTTFYIRWLVCVNNNTEQMYLIQLHINHNNHDRFRRSKEVFSTILPDFASARAVCEGEYDRDYSEYDRCWTIKELGDSELIQVCDDPVLYKVNYPEKTIYEEERRKMESYITES